MPELKTIRVKIADLFQFEGEPTPETTPGVTEVTHLVLKHYGFLSQPLMVAIEGDEVVLRYPGEPDAAQAEAACLAEKAAKRAAQGKYGKAIDILKRVLELQPSQCFDRSSYSGSFRIAGTSTWGAQSGANNTRNVIYGADGGHSELDAILDRIDLSAASVTRIETLGFHRLSEIHRRWLEAAFNRMRIIPLNDAIAERAISLRQERRMGLTDAIIAATALVHDLQLVTRNVEDFQHVDGLRLSNPIASTG